MFVLVAPSSGHHENENGVSWMFVKCLKVPFVVVFLFLDGMFINSMESWASLQAQKLILKKGFSRATYLLLDLLVALSSGHH